MNIGGIEYRVVFDAEKQGAGFQTSPPTMWIGCDCTLQEMANSVMHEALEAVLLQDVKRLTPNCTHIGDVCDDNTRYVFHFDHDYLCTLTYKLQYALLTSGFYKIVDGRPDRMKKKKGKGKGCK